MGIERWWPRSRAWFRVIRPDEKQLVAMWAVHWAEMNTGRQRVDEMSRAFIAFELTALLVVPGDGHRLVPDHKGARPRHDSEHIAERELRVQLVEHRQLDAEHPRRLGKQRSGCDDECVRVD